MDSTQRFFTLHAPLDAIPAPRQTRAANLSGFEKVVSRLGADPARILAEHGIHPDFLAHPDRFIDARAYISALQYGRDRLGAELFGLEIAAVQNFDVFGCLDSLCRSAPDFGSALAAFCAYIPVVQTPECAFELTVSDDLAEVRWGLRSDFGPYDQVNQKSALLLVRFLSSLCDDVTPDHVAITTDVPPHQRDRAQEMFGCRLLVAQPVDLIAFPRALLDHKLPCADKVTFGLLSRYLESVKAAAAESMPSTSKRVEDHMRGSMSDGDCTLERCAERLGLSPKQLRSRLAKEGASFSEILARERMARAATYLTETSISVDEIAGLLGYSESTSFGRAFRRWNGLSPAEYRRNRARRAAGL
jgi:AraC-like DNA-binding protein